MRPTLRVAFALCLLAPLVGSIGTEPAAASTRPVATEAEYRQALADLSADGSGPHTITLTADLVLDDGTDPTYSGATDLTVDGDGHTVDANGTGRILVVTVAGGTRTVTIEDVTMTGGAAAGNGGALLVAGAILDVTSSTFHANTAAGSGGAIAGDIGYLTNSTVTANTATSEGGGVRFASGMGIQYSTLVGNTAAIGANLSTYGDLNAFASVVADPRGGGTNCRRGAGGVSAGYSWSTDASCQFTATGDVNDGADPALGALADNGGPTPTRLPAPRSPLLDRIPTAACSTTVTVDQRGESRPFGDGCDTGAVERTPQGQSTFVVGDETGYRDAVAAAAFEDTGTITVVLTADITLTEGTDPVYRGTRPLVIDGDGHHLDGGDTSRLIDVASTAGLSIVDTQVTGGATTGDGGAVRSAGAVTVRGSTLSDNHAVGNGGGVRAAMVTVVDSTVVDNTAGGSGGGLHATGGTHLDQVTLTGNGAPSGANLSTPGTADLSATVLAQPAGSGNCAVGATTATGRNWADDATCGLPDGDEHAAGDPMLGAPRDNGGPTPTRYPMLGSPLRDAIAAVDCDPSLPTDQRGAARPFPAGGACDIGAVEAAHPPTVTVTAPADGTVVPRDAALVADYHCAGATGGSGLVSCTASVADGSALPTTTVGDHTFTVTATEHAGDTAQVTHTYTVALARPDARIQRGATRLRGNDIYNTLTGQTVSGTARPGTSVTYYANLQNDAGFPDTLRVRGRGDTTSFTVRYRNPAGTNITTAVRNGTYTTPTLAAGATHRITVTVNVRRTAPAGVSLTRTVKATSTTHPTRTDTVRTTTSRR